MSLLRIEAALVSALAIGGAAAAIAEESHSSPPPPPALPAFQRIFIPVEEIQTHQWKQGYLPLETKEFERVLQTLQAAASGAPDARAAHVESCQFSAQLVGDDLLVGSGTLKVARRSEAASMLLLDPCNLALSAAAWQGKNASRTVYGTGPDGRLRVLVEGSQLDCTWSMRGERTASGAVEFQIELPSSPMAGLSVEAPRGLDLTADKGIVAASAGSGAQSNRWTIELGGHHRFMLRVVPEDVARQRRQLTLLRQAATYEFTARGINIVSQMRLDVHGEPLERIAVDLDPTLRLVAARYGEQEVPWSATADVETRVSHAVLQLPEPILGTGRVLNLRAMAPLVSGKPWRLPAMRPTGMSWQEGTAELLIPNAFTLEQLTTDGCRQSRISPLPAPLAGESIEVQFYRPGGTIDVQLALEHERLKVDSGTLVEVASSEATGVASLRFGLARGQRRTVRVEVQPDWIIDAVENPETGRAANWEFEESPAERTILKVRCDMPIASDHPARLLVRGRRPLSTAGVFDARQLEMLSLDTFERGTILIGVRAADGSELRWTDSEELNRLDPLELTQDEIALFSQTPAGMVVAQDADFARATVALVRRKPSYTADIRVDVAVQEKVLTETYTIQCSPEAATVERLLVHFSEKRDAPLEWNLAGGASGQFSARRVSAAEQTQMAMPPGGEAWELNLQLARSGPFELRGIRSFPITGETPVALASVAEAASQRGTLAIRALSSAGLSIKNRRLTPVPAELLDADHIQTVRANYRYQPARDDLGPEAAVSIAPAQATQAESGAWAWYHRLDSRYAPDGTSVHWASFQIQTAGRQKLRLSLESGAKLQAAWLDGQRLILEPNSALDGMVIELAPGRCFASLSLNYTTPHALPSLVASREPPFPRLDIPVLARQWSVWLPPGYAILDEDSRFPSDAIVPLSWSQRLFGVLGRGAGQKIFNPLAAADWRTTLGGGDIQVAQDAADAFARNLGATVSDFESSEELTWGQLLASCAEAEVPVRGALLVDAAGLEWLEVNSLTRARFQPGGTDLERGYAVLQHARLVLIADAGAIVVTSGPSAASYAPQLSPPQHGVVYALSAGPLADEVRRATRRGEWSRFQTIEAWRAAPTPGSNPWSALGAASPNFNEAPGWAVYSFPLSDASKPSVRIVCMPAMSSLSWAVFLAIVSLGLWIAVVPNIALYALVATSVFVALVLPGAYAPLASASLLGGLLCLALRATRIPKLRVRSSDASRGSHKLRSSVARELARPVLIAVMANGAWLASASQPSTTRAPTDEVIESSSKATASEVVPAKTGPVDDSSQPGLASNPAARAEPAHAPIHSVLIPCDDRQNPVGGKCYLPQELYREFYRQIAATSDEPKQWLITRGLYQGTLVRDPVDRRLGLKRLTARFDLDVFQADVRVLLPLARDGAGAAVVAARLEGRPISLTWSAAGDALAIGPLAAERYRLELDLQPALQADATAAWFDIKIPPLANASIDLTFPPDTPAIEVPTARGQVRREKGGGELSAQLGPTDRLSVRWPLAGGRQAAAPNLEVEELIWVKVRPGTTVLDAKFKYRVLGGRLRQIRLLTDPRLRLLPSMSAQSPIAAVHAIPGDPQRINLELVNPVADQVTIELSFLLTNTSGVGNLRLPRLESSGPRPTRRYMAVSVDASLQPKIQAGEDSRTIEIPEFIAAWGAGDARPQAAYAIPRGEPVWVLSTQPIEPRTSVEENLAVSLGRASSPIRFDASLSIVGGHLLQLGLQGPSGLVVEQVSILEDEMQRVARWTVDKRGRISVFLNAPIDGRQRLTLRGRWNATPSKPFAAPQIELLGAEVKKRQLYLYRQPAVLAEVKKTPGVTELELDDDEVLDGFGSLLGGYSIEDSKAPVTITLAPNFARSRAIAATHLARNGDHWVADLYYHLEVLEGLVDSLQFEIPPQWSEPYRIEPPMPFKLAPIPGQQRRLLIVYPEQPISGKLQLKIRGRVAPSAGDRLRAPDILPLRSQQIERYVVLPRHLELQQITWETFGLSPSQLPSEVRPSTPAATPHWVYQVVGERFQASLRAVERASAASQVALADMHVVWQGDGNCAGVAIFDLEPAGATNCVLELPETCRLLHVSIESLPALLSPLDANRWRLTLASQRLPQRIEVIFVCPYSGTTQRKQFRAPRLPGLEVARTSWTLYGPSGFGGSRPARADIAVTPSQQGLDRLKTINALVQLPAEAIGEHLPEEIGRWYRAWKDRYTASRAVLARHLNSTRQNPMSSDADIGARDLDLQMLAVDSRLGGKSPPTRQGVQTTPSTELLAGARSNLMPAHYTVRGEQYDLELTYPQAEVSSWWPRLLSGLAILLAGGAGAFFFGQRSLPVFSPASMIGGLGLAWWLFLAPSAFGLVALAVSAWLALRAQWPANDRLRRG